MAEVKWIKIVTDIFDDEKMLMIESLPERDGIIVMWFKLLCLAGKQNNNGVFMFNDKIPYTDEMLSTIFRRPLNTVRLALTTFEQYGMIEIVNNTITIPKWEKHQKVESLDMYRENGRKRVAKFRQKQKEIICNVTGNVTHSECNVTVTGIDKDKEIDIEEDKEKDNIYADFENEFETLWKAYPRKEGKTNARKAYIKARTDKEPVSFEQVQQGVERYVKYIKANNTEQKYIKHGSTWFNQHCWDDDYTISDNSSRPEGYEIIKQEPNDDGGITYHYANGIVRVFDEYNMMIDEYKE